MHTPNHAHTDVGFRLHPDARYLLACGASV